MSMDGIGKNKIDLNMLKAGFELKNVAGNEKMESIFRTLDSDANGVLDIEELSKFFQSADSEDVDMVLTGKEAKAFIKGNTDLKDAKIKKEDLLAFLSKMQEQSENIDTVEIVTINDEKAVVVKYKDTNLKQKTFYKNGDYEVLSEDEAGNIITELRNTDDTLLRKSIKNGDNSETTEYETDGETKSKVISEEAPSKKTVTDYESGVPTTRVIIENNLETTYQYNAETQAFEKTREIANKGHDVLEQTTVYNPASGVRTEVRSEDGVKSTSTFVDDEFISRTSEASNYTEETKYDNAGQHGFITNRTYKNGNSAVIYSNTEDLNTRTYERFEINGKIYEANYDGNGNTYVVVQYGETFSDFCKNMGVTKDELLELNKDNQKFNGGKQGSTVLVPKYIEPYSNKFKNRKSAEDVQELLRQDALRWRSIQQRENDKPQLKMKFENTTNRNKQHERKFKTDMTWRDVALELFWQEAGKPKGNKVPVSDEELKIRAEILKKMNPGIKDGEIYGKKINVKFDTSRFEQVQSNRGVVETDAFYAKTFRELARECFLHDVGYTPGPHDELEISYLEGVLKELNPNIKDGELQDKRLKMVSKRNSVFFTVTTKSNTARDVGEPVMRAMLRNKGEHSQAKLNALAKITTREEFLAYKSCCEGVSGSEGNHKWETWLYLIPEQDRDTFIQKWYKQDILTNDDLINLQADRAYWAIRDACDGLNVFSNSEQIRQAVKLFVDPTGQNNPEFAQQVYQLVDKRILNETGKNAKFTFSGQQNLRQYIHDEFWVFQSDRDNYDLNLAVQGAKDIHGIPRAGETQEQADSRERVALAVKTFKSATVGIGTNEHSMEDVLKFLKNKDEFLAFKNSIKNDYSWNGYKDVVQYALYDELSLDEIGRINEMLISKGFYENSEANEIRAFYKVQVLKDGDSGKIKNAFRTISSREEFDLIDKQLNGGFVNYVRSQSRLVQDKNLVLASAGKYLSKNDQIDVAYNLLTGNGQFLVDETTVSAALNCIQSEEVARAVDLRLGRKNTSIEQLRKKYCKDKVTYVTDRPLMEAVTPARLSQKQIQQNKATVEIFKEQLADFEAQYDAVKDREGALSEFIDGLYDNIGVGISASDLEELIAYDKETLQYMTLAAEGKLDQLKNGQRTNISLQEVIKLRASNVRRLSAAKSITRTTKESSVGATNEEIQQMSKDMELLSYENDCRASLLTSWNYISRVNQNSSNVELSRAIEDTISNLNSFSKSEGMEFVLPSPYVFVDGVIKNKQTNQDASSQELMTLVNNLRKGLSDVTKGMLGVEIPPNASYIKAKTVFDKTFKEKKDFVTSTYEKAYGRVMPDSLLEKHSTYINYGKMVVQVVGTIAVAAATSVATQGSGIALFLSTTATSVTLGSVDSVTSANGITASEGREVLSGALWDGLLTMSGFKVGQAAEKFVRGEFKFARSVLTKNEKLIHKMSPNLGAKSVEKAAVYLARAEAAGIEITSDTLQTLLQQYCMYGEIREQEFVAGILMSVGGNAIGHAVSIKNDVKIKAKQAEIPQMSGDALTSSQAKTESLLHKLEQEYKDTPFMEDINALRDIVGQVTDPNVRAYIDSFLQHIIDVPSSAHQGGFIKIRELTDAVNTFNGNYSVYINPNDIDGHSAMARFSKFVKRGGLTVDDAAKNPMSAIDESLSPQNEALRQDLAVENKLYGIRQYMKRNQGTPMADYIYDSYYLNYLKEKNVSLKVIEQLSDFNKKHGVKIMLPEQFNNSDVSKVFKLMENEFDEWKHQSGGTANIPPMVDFSTAKANWYDKSSAHGQGVSAAYQEDGNNSLAFGEFSEARVKYAIRHEMTHANDAKRGLNIPDKYNLDEIMPKKPVEVNGETVMPHERLVADVNMKQEYTVVDAEEYILADVNANNSNNNLKSYLVKIDGQPIKVDAPAGAMKEEILAKAREKAQKIAANSKPRAISFNSTKDAREFSNHTMQRLVGKTPQGLQRTRLLDIDSAIESLPDGDLKNYINNRLSSVKKYSDFDEIELLINAHNEMNSITSHYMDLDFQTMSNGQVSLKRNLSDNAKLSKMEKTDGFAGVHQVLESDARQGGLNKSQRNDIFMSDIRQNERMSSAIEYMSKYPNNEMSEKFYSNYIQNRFANNPEFAARLNNINKEYGVKIIVPSKYSKSSMVETTNYVESVLAEFKNASNGQAKLPPVIDFGTAKPYWYSTKLSFGMGMGVNAVQHGETGSLGFHNMDEKTVKQSLKHELTHANDLTQTVAIKTDKYDFNKMMPKKTIISEGKKIIVPDFANCKYINEFRAAGISENNIPNAFKNPVEFQKVAIEGDMTKYSPEFKQILIDFGTPESWFKYNFKKIFPRKTIVEYGKMKEIPDISKAKYADEFRTAGLPEYKILYAHNNPQEYIAVASEGDVSKYSEEFKQLLIDLGMPEWRFKMQ